MTEMEAAGTAYDALSADEQALRGPRPVKYNLP